MGKPFKIISIVLSITVAALCIANNSFALRPIAFQCEGAKEDNKQASQSIASSEEDLIIRNEVEALVERLSDDLANKQKRIDDLVGKIHLVGFVGMSAVALFKFLSILIVSLLVKPYLIIALLLGFIFIPVITMVAFLAYFLVFMLISHLMVPAYNIRDLGVYIDKGLPKDTLPEAIAHELGHRILGCYNFLAETVYEMRNLERETAKGYLSLDTLSFCINTPFEEIDEKLQEYQERVKTHDNSLDSKFAKVIKSPASSEPSWSYNYGKALAHIILLYCYNDFSKAYAVVRNMAKGDSLSEALKKVGITEIDKERIKRYREMPVTEFNAYVPYAAQVKSTFFDEESKSTDAHLRKRSETYLVDVGAATGKLSVFLAQNNPRATIYACTPSDQDCRYIQQEAPGVTILPESLGHSNNEELIGKVDKIFWFLPEGALPSGASEIAELLKAEGVFTIALDAYDAGRFETLKKQLMRKGLIVDYRLGETYGPLSKYKELDNVTTSSGAFYHFAFRYYPPGYSSAVLRAIRVPISYARRPFKERVGDLGILAAA